MKTPHHEIVEALMANSGNRLTSELIAGLQARLGHILDQALTAQSEQLKGEQSQSEKQDG